MIQPLDLPLSHADVRELHVGDEVSLTGTLFTARANLFEFARESGDLSFVEDGSLLYVSGPVGKRKGRRWSTTSIAPDHCGPLDPHVREMIVRLGVRGLIGRGDLGKGTIEACRQLGAVYLGTVGGAGPGLARRVEEVKSVHLTDRFEARDACWELAVRDFPAVVLVDAHGQSLHEIVRDASTRRLLNLQL